MLRKILFISMISQLLFLPIAFGYEIFLKDGRIIETSILWEKDDVVNYQKFGTTIGIPRENVERIVGQKTKQYRYSSIYLKTGEKIYCNRIVEKDKEVTCDENKRVAPIYYKKDIAKILKGRNHDFLDLPLEAQKKWEKATVYFKNGGSLLVSTVWADKKYLYCSTPQKDYKYGVDQIKRVSKGHDRRAKFDELTAERQKQVLQAQKEKELRQKKALKERRKRALMKRINLEASIDKMIQGK